MREPREPKTLRELRWLDPVANAVLTAWEHGEFPTFEQALIALVLALYKQKAIAIEELIQMRERLPTTSTEIEKKRLDS